MSATFQIRPAAPDDAPHVFSTFYHSIRVRLGGRHNFIESNARIQHCLAVGTVYIACPINDPDLHAGWIAWDGEALLYCYVKPAFRASRAGEAIGTMLVQSTIPESARKLNKVEVPYLTHNGRALLKALGLSCIEADGLIHDRVHVDKGKLLSSKPIVVPVAQQSEPPGCLGECVGENPTGHPPSSREAMLVSLGFEIPSEEQKAANLEYNLMMIQSQNKV